MDFEGYVYSISCIYDRLFRVVDTLSIRTCSQLILLWACDIITWSVCLYFKSSAIMETAAKVFFSSPRFAVAGASQDPNKFGYKGASVEKCQGGLLMRMFENSVGLVSCAFVECPARNTVATKHQDILNRVSHCLVTFRPSVSAGNLSQHYNSTLRNAQHLAGG